MTIGGYDTSIVKMPSNIKWVELICVEHWEINIQTLKFAD